MENKELTKALQAHKEAMDAQVLAIKEANEAEVVKLKADLEEMETKRDTMQKQLDDQNLLITKNAKDFKKKTVEAEVTLQKALADLLETKEYKEALAKGFPKGENTFQLKASTADITGTVNMTRQDLSVSFAPERALAFIPNINSGGSIGANKNRVLWVEGTYTSNVGYVDEAGAATGDTGAAVEKSRAMAKISAKLVLTDEMLSDASYVASAFKMKMQEKAMIFTDGECYDGAGSDATYPKRIYGIKDQSTAFDATTSGSAGTVDSPNIGDLVDATILQAEVAEQRGLNKIWMNSKDFFKLRTTKDADGNRIFVKDVNGGYTISGLKVIKTSKVTTNTMLVADSGKIQLWWKKNPTVKFGQMNGTDMEKDQYTAVMFLRNQIVVETLDQTALIYVSDITAALNAIKKVTA